MTTFIVVGLIVIIGCAVLGGVQLNNKDEPIALVCALSLGAAYLIIGLMVVIPIEQEDYAMQKVEEFKEKHNIQTKIIDKQITTKDTIYFIGECDEKVRENQTCNGHSEGSAH